MKGRKFKHPLRKRKPSKAVSGYTAETSQSRLSYERECKNRTMGITKKINNQKRSSIKSALKKLLKEAELDPTCITSNPASNVGEETELHTSAEQNDVEKMKELLNRDPTLINRGDRDGKTPLHIACEMECFEAAEYLLKYKKCSVKIIDRDGKSALHYAAENRDGDIMKLLLKRKSEVLEIINKPDVNGETALYIACKYGRKEAVKSLLKSQRKCSVNDVKLPLHCAAENDYVEIVKLLLNHDHKIISKQDEDGETALHLACTLGNHEIVDVLLSSGANIKVSDKLGNTCFHNAALSKVCKIMSALLNKEPKLLHERNNKQQTALHVAASIRNDTAIQFLLNCKGCEVSVRDENDDTPLHLYVDAYKQKHFDIQDSDIYVFKDKCNVDVVNIANKDGETPLHKAVQVADHESVKTLIELGADVNKKSKNGENPLHLAQNLFDSFKKESIISNISVRCN